jgi:hypothetical protein
VKHDSQSNPMLKDENKIKNQFKKGLKNYSNQHELTNQTYNLSHETRIIL